jgi:uncharacterized membrane protein
MNGSHVLLLAVAIGVIGGLRAITAPAVVAWAAHLGWINLHGTPLSFMGSIAAMIVFTLAAAGEIVNDKLPKTPSRLAPGGLAPRILFGGLSGAAVAFAGGQAWWLGVVLGIVGCLAGAVAGYQVRMRIVKALGIKDLYIALLEDLVAVCGGLFIVSHL